MKNKKGMVAPLILIFFVAIAGAIAVYYNILGTGSLIGITNVYKAFFGHICCEEGAYEPAYIRYADAVPTYTCDGYTDECHMEFIYGSKPWTLGAGSDVCYKINSGSMIRRTWGTQGEILLPYKSKIDFISCGFNQDARKYYQYSAKFRKFYIQGEENGKIYTSNSCILNYDLKQRVLSDGLNELSKTGVNRCQNYFTDFVLVDTKTYNYLGQNVICQARNLYKIDSISLKDGSSRLIQGNLIKSVDCCPQESNCDDDFKFKAIVTKECDYDYQCANAGEPVAITGTSYVNFKCVSGKCTQGSAVTVECTNNAICVDKLGKSNAVCKDWKCGVDDEWLGHCGDKYCDTVIGETPTSCPDDCGKWEKPINWIFWIILIIIIAVLLYFLWPVIISLLQGLRMVLKSIPILGRIVP